VVYSKLLSKLDNGELELIRLSDTYNIKPFDCGNTRLNNFLFKDAKTHLQYLSIVTYLLENKDKTIAYYSLQNGLLKINPHYDQEFDKELSDIIADKDYSYLLEMKESAEYPAVKIGRFAIDLEFQRSGYGTQILHLIIMSFLTNNKTGCQFITVDALNNPETIRFYEKNGFLFVTIADLNKPSRQMYKNLIALKQLEYL